ncbi:MAG: amidohydrolase family protein [Candidatus Thorarchaeota archaeon]
MLVVRAVEDIPERSIKKDDKFQLYIVDAHHHMGREGSHKNSPSGAYDFYALLWFELQRMAKDQIEKDLLLFEPLEVVPPDLPARMFSSKENWARMNHGWLVDRTIAFSYSDDYSKSDSPDVPSFRVSNDKIAGWTTRAPHSSRLIGFARVDPKDALNGSHNIPVKEIERAVKVLGLRGLKLHPLAQLFVDEITADYMKDIMKCAGELGIPVIMDTRNIRTVLRIRELIESMRGVKKYRESLRGLAVILAHCGMSPGNTRFYEVLRDPVFFGETSSLHGKDIPILFGMASERIEAPGGRWSEKILFGTDYSFLSVQAAELILYLISRSFEGSLTDAQRILGGNALILAQRPFKSGNGVTLKPKGVICEECKPEAMNDLEKSILSLLGKEWDISSLDFLIPPRHTWPRIRSLEEGGYNGVHFNSYVLTLRHSGKETHVWIREIPGGLMSCSILGTIGKPTLDTAEYAAQKLSPELSDLLRKNTVTVRTTEELVASVLRILT